jgi:hypothetical protein
MKFTGTYSLPPNGDVEVVTLLCMLSQAFSPEVYDEYSAAQAAAYSGPEPDVGRRVFEVVVVASVLATKAKIANSRLAGSSKAFIMKFSFPWPRGRGGYSTSRRRSFTKRSEASVVCGDASCGGQISERGRRSDEVRWKVRSEIAGHGAKPRQRTGAVWFPAGDLRARLPAHFLVSMAR